MPEVRKGIRLNKNPGAGKCLSRALQTKKRGITRYREASEERSDLRRAGGSLSCAYYRRKGEQSLDREGGEPRPKGPTVGKAKPGITFSWEEIWEIVPDH